MIRAALLLSVGMSALAQAKSTLTFTAQWQTGLFKTGDDVGMLNPHVYRPEEFSVNDLVYEGLVAWDPTAAGADGILGTDDDDVIGTLATSWTTNFAAVESNPATPYEITFSLRSGVTFHDGTAWNAAAAKLNFDHIMGSFAKYRAGFHDWFGLPAAMASWEAVGELEFRIVFTSYYEAALRELTQIRPFRMVSPAALPNIGANRLSCNEWMPWANAVRTWGPFECAGILAPIGTGPYKIVGKYLETAAGAGRLLPAADFAATCSNGGGTTLRYLNCIYAPGEYLKELRFEKFGAYTPTAVTTSPTFDEVIMRAYDSQAAVQAALLDGSLDMAYGLNALSPSGFISLAARDNSLAAHVADRDLNTRFIGLHSGGALNTLELRKMVMCIMNRTLLFDGELAEEVPLETLFDPSLPYVHYSASPLSDVGTLCAGLTATLADVTRSLRFLYPTGSAHVEGIVFFFVGLLYTAGINVTPMPKSKDEYNAELGRWAGDDGEAYTTDDWPTWPSGVPTTSPTWDLAYSETWGPMYDATTSLTDIAYTWPAEVWSEATNYLSTISKAELNDKIKALSGIVDDAARKAAYREVLAILHDEAIFLPLTAKRNTAMTSTRVSGFSFAPTEFGTASVVSALYPTHPAEEPNTLSGDAIAAIVIAVAVAVAVLLGVIALLITREKQGIPIFTQLAAPLPAGKDPEIIVSDKA
jgi:ABC-type transport system substrate-binding protein